MAPAPFSTVCFRARPAGLSEEELDDLNDTLLRQLNAEGESFISHTRLYDRLTLRLAIGNLRTEERHVRRVWELLNQLKSAACAQNR
jgi:aromatic-L-amino-acid decarboxylase